MGPGAGAPPGRSGSYCYYQEEPSGDRQHKPGERPGKRPCQHQYKSAQAAAVKKGARQQTLMTSYGDRNVALDHVISHITRERAAVGAMRAALGLR